MEILYQPFVWFVKLPLFLMLYKIFGRLRWMRWAVYLGLLATTLFAIASVTVAAVYYTPLANNAQSDIMNNLERPLGWLRNESPSYEMAALNLANDLFLLILPMPVVWSLNVPVRKRISISAMFFLGTG